jgi:hypothetical protein
VVDVARLDTDERAAVVAAQRAGRVVAGDPSDVMALVIAMSMASSPVSDACAATAEEDAAVHAERPRFLRQAVRAATST